MPTDRLSIKNRQVRAGEGERTISLPLQFSDTELFVTVVVDDPAANPAPPADFEIHVEALRDDVFVPVSSFVFGMTGIMESLVPVRGRTLRIRYLAGMDHRISLTATVP